MRFVRVLVAAIIGSVALNVAHADPYTFYGVENHLSQSITNSHYQSGGQACQQVVGNLYTVTPLEFVVSTEYETGTTNCHIRTSTDTMRVGTVVSAGGSCADDIEFNFELQQCAAVANIEQLYSVVVALFGFAVLSAGIVIGFKFGY